MRSAVCGGANDMKSVPTRSGIKRVRHSRTRKRTNARSAGFCEGSERGSEIRICVEKCVRIP